MTEPKFFFIRHGQLVAPYLNHLTMDYRTLTDLSLGSLDPSINHNASELFVRQTANVDLAQVHTVYYNSSGISSARSLESARCIVDSLKQRYGEAVQLYGLPDIREVRFDVSGLVSEPEFNKHGMAAIRSALYRAVIHGGAAEPLAEVAGRIRILQGVVEEHARKGESVLFVTHDFFMRFLEVYITRRERLDGVSVEDLERTGLNYYFAGFTGDSSLRTLERWGRQIL